MKKAIYIIIFVTILAVIFAKDKIIEISAEKTFSFILGTKLSIGSMRVGIIRPVIDIRNIKLYNPEGYPTEIMADIPEIYVRYDLPQIMKGNVYLKELRFSMKELDIVKNSEGKINLNSLKPVANKEDGKQIEEQEKGQIPDMQIDTLYLKADIVVYRDYSGRSAEPKISTFEINLDEEYRNIDDPYTLARLIIYRVLMNTTVGKLVKVPTTEVQEVMANAYEAGAKVVTTTVEKTSETTSKIVEGTSDALKKTMEGFKNPFGGGREE